MKEKELKETRNSDLLSAYGEAVRAGEFCLRHHDFDAHKHFHTAKELGREIISRMNQPDVVKLKVK